jgi:hypothetical protein
LNPHALLKARDFKPPVCVLYRQLLGYTAIFSGKLMVSRRLVGRGIPTNTVIYLAISSKQPPVRFVYDREHDAIADARANPEHLFRGVRGV